MPRHHGFIDFRAIKAAVSMEQALEHYGLKDKLRPIGNDGLTGCCPIHKGTNPTQFRVSRSKNCWKCFSDCLGGGNVLDFISRMEGVPIHSAALLAAEWFNVHLGAQTRQVAAILGIDHKTLEKWEHNRLSIGSKSQPRVLAFINNGRLKTQQLTSRTGGVGNLLPRATLSQRSKSH